MTLRPLPTVLIISCLALPALLAAQTSANEEERMEALTRADTSDWLVPKNTVSIGFRVLSSGAKVNFSHLGEVPASITVPPPSDGAVPRSYNNGYVNVDSPRPAELDADGNQISQQGGQYVTTATTTVDVTDADGNVIGTQDVTAVSGVFRSFTPGFTRNWSYAVAGQTTARPGYIAMSTYSTTSDGAFFDKKQGPSAGVEMHFEHTLGRLSKHTEWRLLTGIALNDINSKTGGDILATLHTNTDFYTLNGQPAPDLPAPTTDATTGVTTNPPYSAPSFGDLTDSNGNVLITSGLETTVPIGAEPDGALSTSTAVTGGATVHGNYQVKGAYFMVKLGPSVRSQLTERLGLTASVGVAGAYAGSRYSVVESFSIPEIGTSLTATQENTASKFLSGYYADLNLEWLANDRTGLFGGISAQKFSDYDQTVGGRTAHIDLGSSVGIRGGISIKF